MTSGELGKRANEFQGGNLLDVSGVIRELVICLMPRHTYGMARQNDEPDGQTRDSLDLNRVRERQLGCGGLQRSSPSVDVSVRGFGFVVDHPDEPQPFEDL